MSYVYILECERGMLYTGYCTDLERRMKQHFSGRGGAKFTRAFKPRKVVAVWNLSGDKSRAMRVESFVKGLSRREKLAIVRSPGILKSMLLESEKFDPGETGGIESLDLKEINNRIEFFIGEVNGTDN